MPIYRKGDDQFPLWNRAKEQEDSHTMSDADSGGYIVGFNPNMPVSELKGMGDMPVSAKGIRMGQNAKHWKDKYPHMWGGDNG
jgi:hypothetical protein